MSDPPTEDAYGRLTNPERFRQLWPVAEELLAHLARDYRVTWDEGPNLDPGLTSSVTGGVSRVVRVAPSEGGGAQLVVAYTGFPGLRVRFGKWHGEGFPACGCDACDEQPADLAVDLAEKVEIVVSGGFTERLTLLARPGLSYSFGGTRGWSRLSRRQVVKMGTPRTIKWCAWPRVA